jgi:DNA polymerase V
MKGNLIGLLDCNNFFVSCERLFRPDLIDKPVVVLSSNDGCVVARSKEIKDIGVPMGVPYFQIKDTLEKVGAITFSSHLSLYRDISRRVFSIMREELDDIEQYSVDEAFFKVTGDPNQLAKKLKDSVEKKVGIPVSIGMAQTKTQAKYANNLAKKSSGIFVLDDLVWQESVRSINLAEVWGVGGQTELKFKRHGLVSVADLMSADKLRLASIFGINGLRLQQELLGNPMYMVERKRDPQKSILSSRSFKKTTKDKMVLADAIAYHVTQTTKDLRSMNMETTAIRLSIRPDRYGDFLLRGGSKEAILDIPTSSTLKLLKVANSMLDELFEDDVLYKKVGITLSNFVPKEQVQPDLFVSTDSGKDAVLMKMIDDINSKKNGKLISIGSRLKEEIWRSKQDSLSPSYTTRWNDIKTVRT